MFFYCIMCIELYGKGMVKITGKRILIAGGSHAELPLIEAAKRQGNVVITTGNNTDGIGHKMADRYIPGDFSDKEFILQLARQEKVDAVVSGCNDFSYLSTAYACEQLGLPGHDTYETARLVHHKDCFRDLTRSLGIKTPLAYTCSERQEVVGVCDRLTFPVVVKPTDLTGGKGVVVCRTKTEVLSAYENAKKVTREPKVIVEEYVEGSNHGASVILKNQKVVFGFCDKEQYYKNHYLVSGACFPPDVSYCTMVQLFSDIEKVADKLQLADGIFHTQFIVDRDGMPVMIDPCRRAPGDLYILLVKYSTGVDYPLEILKAECGEEVDESYAIHYRNVARECIMTDQNGILENIQIAKEIRECLIDQLIWGKKGDPVCDYMKYKAGILFFECDDYRNLYDLVDRFHHLVTIEVD